MKCGNRVKKNSMLIVLAVILTVLLCTVTVPAAEYFATDGGVSVIPVFANTGAADTAMGTPVQGALIYSTSDGGIMYYDGSAWVSIESLADGTAANNTLRWNGSDWVESTALTNDGTDVAASGNITATGDVAVNGGDITSTAATVNVVNTNATTVNIASASTATAIGAATGTTTIGNDLTATGDTTVTGGDITIGAGTTAKQGTIVLHDNQTGDSFTTSIRAAADVNADFTPFHRQFEERFNVITREAYGMTEIGPGMFVPPEDDHMTGSGSVGVPFESRQVRIVDDRDKDVFRGEVGELWIKGPGMFKGYYNKPGETAAAFDGEWFKTGDLFRQDDNGYFYIVGRKKDMIRRTGDNISASEVEYVLTSHPKIMSAAVIPVPDPERNEEVKAYIAPAKGETPGSIPPEDIIAFCKDRIAAFKIPRYIEYVDEFQRTATGKIQKHVLIAAGQDLTAGCYDRLAEDDN